LETLGDTGVKTTLHDPFNITKGKELNPPSSPRIISKLVSSLEGKVSNERPNLPVLGEASQLPFNYTPSTIYLFSQPRTLDFGQSLEIIIP